MNDGDTIIIDSGFTTMELAKNLSRIKNLTVCTNAIHVASQSAHIKTANVIVPGGILRSESLSLVESNSEKSFKNFFCDKLFIGVDGIDIKHGLSTPNVEEAELNRTMIEMSKQVIAVADSSKFFKRSFVSICKISRIDVLITDDGIDPDHKIALEQAGVKVLIA